MRKLIFATVLAIAAAAPVAASAQDSVIIRDRGIYSNDDGDYWRHRHRERSGVRFGLTIGSPDYGDRYYYRPHYRHHRRDCETRWVRHWRHHHRVVEKITVCRRY